MKVMTVVGTRPEIIKLSRVIARFDEAFEHVLVHTGQNHEYELNGVFFDGMGIRDPDHHLEVGSDSPAATIAAVITRADEVLAGEEPDALLVLGDTNSALCVIAAKKRRIPIFHMEAGNRCFDERVPEEMNRRIVDHVADVNLPYTEHARRYLLAEGLPADRVIKTGSPMAEVLDHYGPAIDGSRALSERGLAPGGYLVASIHREDNVDDPERLASIVAGLNALVAEVAVPMILSTHPRTRDRLAGSGLELSDAIQALPPLGFIDYVALEKHSLCTISDSGTITEEAALVGFPAVTVRQSHERPEGMDSGVLQVTEPRPDALIAAVRRVKAKFDAAGPPSVPDDYRVTDVSWKVAGIIAGYTDFVNRLVWRE